MSLKILRAVVNPSILLGFFILFNLVNTDCGVLIIFPLLSLSVVLVTESIRPLGTK